jgi:hypothetical protein
MRKHITGLERSYDHVKVAQGQGDETWEPVMVIKRNRIMGKSFMITLGALWKYGDPINSRDPKVLRADMEEFDNLMSKVEAMERFAVSPFDKGRAMADHICVEFAGLLNKSHGFLLCTGYNLAKIMQMMEIWPKGNLPQAAAQLLMWIQDGLDQLKDMPGEPEGEDKQVMGEITILEGGRKVATKDIEITDSELRMEGE